MEVVMPARVLAVTLALCLAASAAVPAAVIAAPTAGPSYTIVDLGTLPGGNSSVAYAINQQNQVVGQSTTDATNTIHAFL